MRSALGAAAVRLGLGWIASVAGNVSQQFRRPLLRQIRPGWYARVATLRSFALASREFCYG